MVEDELSSALRSAVIRLTRRLRAARADHGLTLGQLSMLFTLDRHGAMSAGELAASEGIRPPSATRPLAVLEERGLITRTASESDRRQSVLTLTDAGRALIADDRRRRDALLSSLLDGLTPSEVRALEQALPVLQRLASA